ncbi:MAG TPA: ADP-ribosylglycohydrolase family protein [Gemmatimonadales bacterium]|nr:ADP-ribosylglycohydrolase family protein [Gemmatimonadales bacterium]
MSADRLAGSILGQALGDALGFVVEAQPPQVARVYVEGWLRGGRAGEWSHPEFPFGQYSDDTQLARELLRSFHDAHGWQPSIFAARLASLFQLRRDVGAGPGTRAAASRLLMNVPWNEAGTPAPYAGNGAAMRSGQLGLLCPDRQAMCQAAHQQALITHRDPRCAAAAAVVARAVALAAARLPIDKAAFLEDLASCAEMQDRSVAGGIRDLNRWLSLAPAEAGRHVHESGLDPGHTESWRGISAFVIPSILWSLYAFLRSPDDYWETICTAIGVGGDTDTMAAIAGAISGARVGVRGLPPELVARVNDRGEWGATELTELAEACAGFVANPTASSS